MELQQTYRDHLTTRIWGLLDEINRIHDIVAGKLLDMESIGIDNKTIKELNCYFNKAEYLAFEAYMLGEVRDLLAK